MKNKKGKFKWDDPIADIMKNAEVIKTTSAIDVQKSFEEAERHRKQQEIEEKEKMNSRSVTCPLCKTIGRFDKFHNEIREDNDIYGSGYSSWSVLDYMCCPNCGVMFKEIEK